VTGFHRLQEAVTASKRVLVRVDFNVPMQDGVVSDDTRLRRAKPTIDLLREAGAKVILLSHFGRPNGQVIANLSLNQIVPALENILGCTVAFANDCVGQIAEQAVRAMRDGDVLLLENTRFHQGETVNDPALASKMAALGDIFVHDAFSVAHRAQVSSFGLATHLPAFAGLAMEYELDHLTQALGTPTHPVLAVVGGAKVSTKMELLKNLVSKVDILCVGGGMANTFLFALGKPVGISLCERGFADTALEILDNAKRSGCEILLPKDVVAATAFAANAPHKVRLAEDVHDDEMILDAGPDAVAALMHAIARAKTVIWNGPLGAFELPPFDRATIQAASYCAQQTTAGKLISVAGGGDTVAALNLAGIADQFTFVSTAGGAFLEWMEGKQLPGILCLSK